LDFEVDSPLELKFEHALSFSAYQPIEAAKRKVNSEMTEDDGTQFFMKKLFNISTSSLSLGGNNAYPFNACDKSPCATHVFKVQM
jgi:hypothetical protein